MKKVTFVALSLLAVVSFSACNGTAPSEGATPLDTTKTAADTAKVADSTVVKADTTVKAAH